MLTLSKLHCFVINTVEPRYHDSEADWTKFVEKSFVFIYNKLFIVNVITELRIYTELTTAVFLDYCICNE